MPYQDALVVPEEVKPDEQVGPLSNVEVLLLNGEHDRHNVEIKRLEEVKANLERSLVTTSRELQNLRDRQTAMLREILKGRGKSAGRLQLKIVRRTTDSTTWIVASKPQES